MKTLSKTDWQNIHSAISKNTHSLNPKFFSIEGILQQIEEKQIGEFIYYAEQNAPFELDENNKPKAQFDENNVVIPLFIINQCQVIDI